MKQIKIILSIALLVTVNATAATYHEVDFDTVAQALNDVKPSDAKIRFGGNTPAFAVNTNEWAGKVGDPATTTARVNIVDDGTGTNNIFHLNGVAVKSVGGALVVAPEKFGGTSSVARVSFDLLSFNRKAGDGSDGYLVIYQASGYDLTGVTDQKIILQMVKAVTTGVSVTGVNGSALATKVAELAFGESDANSTLDLSFEYDGSSAVIAVWESRSKTEFKFDNVVITDDGVFASTGDASIVMFGGLANVFDSGVGTNNAFVSQIGAGAIVQFNGVDSDGGSFGASGTLVNQGVGAALTNSANGLILTTTAISSSNAARTNTVSSGGQLGVNASGGAANFQQSDATEWAFEFNKQVDLKQVVFSGLDAAAKDRMRVTVEGIDYDLSPADTDETAAWSGSVITKVYTFPTSVTVTAGADITIATHDAQATVDPANNKWGLHGVVVDVPYIDFGGNPAFSSNATYKAEMGGDTIVAWFGDDSAGRTNGIGNLANAGVGATLSAVDYGVTMTTLAISSSDPTRTNTVQSGGALGINFADAFAATFDAADLTEWTFEFDKNVQLAKASFKSFAGTDEAEIIIGGVTNLITSADTVEATYEARSIYTFPASVSIAAGTDITIRASVGVWGLRTLLIGLDEASAPEMGYATWAGSWGVDLGSATDNYDSDALNNFGEYVFGGNPTNGNDIGTQPTFDGVNGTYTFSLIGDDTLTAYVVTNLNLVNGSWGTNSTLDVSNNDGVLSNYTDNVGTGPDNLFIKLLVE